MMEIQVEKSDSNQNRINALKILERVCYKYRINPAVRNMTEFLLMNSKWNTAPKIGFKAAWDLAAVYHNALKEKELRFFRYTENEINLIRYFKKIFKQYYLTAGYQRDTERKTFWILGQDLRVKQLIPRLKSAENWLNAPFRFHLSFNPKMACAQAVMFEFPHLVNFILLKHLSRILEFCMRDLIRGFLAAFEKLHGNWRQIIKQNVKNYCLGPNSPVIKPGDHLSLKPQSTSESPVLIVEWFKFRYNNEIISPKQWLHNARVP